MPIIFQTVFGARDKQDTYVLVGKTDNKHKNKEIIRPIQRVIGALQMTLCNTTAQHTEEGGQGLWLLQLTCSQSVLSERWGGSDMRIWGKVTQSEGPEAGERLVPFSGSKATVTGAWKATWRREETKGVRSSPAGVAGHMRGPGFYSRCDGIAWLSAKNWWDLITNPR